MDMNFKMGRKLKVSGHTCVGFVGVLGVDGIDLAGILSSKLFILYLLTFLLRKILAV